MKNKIRIYALPKCLWGENMQYILKMNDIPFEVLDIPESAMYSDYPLAYIGDKKIGDYDDLLNFVRKMKTNNIF